MSYEYSDKSRESEEHALPDIEVFESEEYTQPNGYILGSAMEVTKKGLRITDPEWYTAPGFYFAFGFPGCLWDSDPVGPFDTYEQALTEARESAGYCPHGIADDGDDVCKECPAPELWVLEFDPLWFASCGGSGRTSDSSKAQAWSTKEAAETARDRMAFCDGSQAVRLPDAEARSWGR